MSDVLMEAIAELTRQNRELAARVSAMERDRAEDRELLNAHGQLLTTRGYREDLRKKMEEAS